MKKTCFLCEKRILPKERYKMVAIEVPYINLFFHEGCYGSIKFDLSEFLSLNVNKLYNWCSKINKGKE